MTGWERHQWLRSFDGIVGLIYTIYECPIDFPRHYVIRLCAVNHRFGLERIAMARVACLYDTLDEAADDCADLGLSWLPRQERDDSCIVGTFL